MIFSSARNWIELLARVKRLKLWHKAAGIGLVAAFVFYLTTKPIMAHFNYTHRLALALLDGRLGIEDHPSWLNELVLRRRQVLHRELLPRGDLERDTVSLCFAPLPDGSDCRDVCFFFFHVGQGGRDESAKTDDARFISSFRYLDLDKLREWRGVGFQPRLRHGRAGRRIVFYACATPAGRCWEFLRIGLR